MSELSQTELTCIVESGDLAGSLFVLQAHEQASPEDRQDLFLCLRDGTLLKLFLAGITGQTGPLSGETSACIRTGFTGVDLRTIMQAGATEGDEGQIMADSTAAFYMVISCLNEEEWAAATPVLGMAPGERENFQCTMRELGGLSEFTAALRPADGGPPVAFIATAVGCGMSPAEIASMTVPTTTAPAAAGIAPLDPSDPVAFMSELSPAEQSCISAIADPQQLALIMSIPELATPEESGALFDCFEDETLLRLFITGLIGLTSPLSPETSACVRGGLEDTDLRSVMSAGAERDEQTSMVVSMSAYMLTLSCLNEAEWQAASAATGMDPGGREDLQCAMDQLGGPEGMATALQSEDGSGFISILTAAFTCGVQLEMGSGPGG